MYWTTSRDTTHSGSPPLAAVTQSRGHSSPLHTSPECHDMFVCLLARTPGARGGRGGAGRDGVATVIDTSARTISRVFCPPSSTD